MPVRPTFVFSNDNNVSEFVIIAEQWQVNKYGREIARQC